jgi:hypothetical protein
LDSGFGVGSGFSFSSSSGAPQGPSGVKSSNAGGVGEKVGTRDMRTLFLRVGGAPSAVGVAVDVDVEDVLAAETSDPLSLACSDGSENADTGATGAAGPGAGMEMKLMGGM